MPISNIQTDETYTPMKKYLFLTLLAAAFLAGGGCSSSDDDGWGVIELASPKLKVTTELATATVTWDAVAKTAGYAYALDGAADYTSVDAATTTVTLTALAEGGHTFRLKAVGDLDHTTDSAERTIDFEIDPTLPQPAPTYVKGDETGSVVVSWPAVKGAAGYAYKFGEAASFTEVGADVLSVTQKGLSAEEPIRFTMYAVGQLPDSKDSEPVSLTFQLVDTSEGVWVRKSNGELFAKRRSTRGRSPSAPPIRSRYSSRTFPTASCRTAATAAWVRSTTIGHASPSTPIPQPNTTFAAVWAAWPPIRSTSSGSI